MECKCPIGAKGSELAIQPAKWGVGHFLLWGLGTFCKVGGWALSSLGLGTFFSGGWALSSH